MMRYSQFDVNIGLYHLLTPTIAFKAAFFRDQVKTRPARFANSVKGKTQR